MELTSIFASHIDLVRGYTLESITDRSDHIEFKFSRTNDIPIHIQLCVAHKDEVYATSYTYYKYLRDKCVIDNVRYSPDNTDPAIISYLCIAIQRSAKYVTESIALSIGGAST